MHRIFLVFLACVGVIGCGAATPSSQLITTAPGTRIFAVALMESTNGHCLREDPLFYEDKPGRPRANGIMAVQKRSDDYLVKVWFPGGASSFLVDAVYPGFTSTQVKKDWPMPGIQIITTIKVEIVGDGLQAEWFSGSWDVKVIRKDGKVSPRKRQCLVGDLLY